LPGRGFKPARGLSAWRRIALELWDDPRDPTVYGNLDINMRRALAYLEAVSTPEVKVTVTHLVAKAIARGLAERPEANAIVAGRRIYMRDSIDVYCQVVRESGRDLSGVKIVDADRKSVVDIAGELAASAAKVRSGDDGSEGTKRAVLKAPSFLLGPMISLIDYVSYNLQLDLRRIGVAYDQFGTAMVSNVGHFGVDHGLAPLVPRSHAAIVLLVGRVVDRPVVEDGEVRAAPCMQIGCTFDHRIIDGYQGGAIERIVRETLEDPFKHLGLPSRSSSADAPSPAAAPGTTSNGHSGNGYTARQAGSARETGPRARDGSR